MKRILGTFVLLCLGFSAVAQNGWNWPEDSAEKSKAQTTYTLFSDNYKSGNYEEAKPHLTVLLENYPDLNKSIYQNAIKIYKDEWKNEKDKAAKAAMADKIMGIYDTRFEKYQDDAAKNIDRMAIDAFFFYYLDRDKTSFLLDLYKKTYASKGMKANYACARYYMKMVTLGRTRGVSMSDDEILDIYNMLMKQLELQIGDLKSKSKSTKRHEDIREEVDASLAKLGIIDCEFIVSKLVPKFDETPDDAELANKIFSFAFDGGCTEEEWFGRAAEVVFNSSPNYGVAMLLATRAGKAEDFEKAKTFFRKAVELTDDNTDKGKALKQIAGIERQHGTKTEARNVAMEAIEADPSLSEEMYSMIGDMIFSSAECDGKTDVVQDRARFIAAYEIYRKAGNQSKMRAAQAQFPTISDIFTANKKEDESISVGCWIKMTVKLKRRPDQE